MPSDGVVLVVGGDGYLGSSVVSRLKASGRPVLATSRRGLRGAIPLDLSAAASTWEVPRGLLSAVLVAGISSTAACRENPADSRRVNVEATVDLAQRLGATGAKVVLLSTNMVFDGTVPFTPADAVRCPRTAYGCMKAEAEEAILSIGGGTVLRLSKVLTASMSLVEGWQAAWSRGETVRPFSDLVLAPISSAVAVDVIAAAALARGTPAILQLSASADVTYAELAYRLASAWGVSRERVDPVTVAASGVEVEHVPPHTTLDSWAVLETFQIKPPDPWEAVEAVVQSIGGTVAPDPEGR